MTIDTGAGASSPSVVQIITAAAQKYGLPAWIPLDIAGWETRGSYDANSYNAQDLNGASSVGVFQLNQAGVGAGYSVAQLQDPTLNADLAVSRMQSAYATGVRQGYQGVQLLEYTANNSGWPGNGGIGADSVTVQYDTGLAQYYAQTGGGQNTGTTIVSATSPTQTQAGPAPSSASLVFLQLDDAEKVTGLAKWYHDKGKSVFNVTNIFEYLSDQFKGIGIRVLVTLIGLVILLLAIKSMLPMDVDVEAPANPAVPKSAGGGV